MGKGLGKERRVTQGRGTRVGGWTERDDMGKRGWGWVGVGDQRGKGNTGSGSGDGTQWGQKRIKNGPLHLLNIIPTSESDLYLGIPPR